MYNPRSTTLLIVILNVINYSLGMVDKTIMPKATGMDVVRAVSQKIRNSGIFPEDNRFLLRVAYIETLFNHGDPEIDFAGGIWRVSRYIYTHTTEVEFKFIHEIQEKFGINWVETTWQDLQRPLYSGLAFRIYLHQISEVIPSTIIQQGYLWRIYFNYRGTVDYFVEHVHIFEKENVCEGKMNLFIALDGSTSIGACYFKEAQKYLAHFVTAFYPRLVNIGFMVFSNVTSVIIPLNPQITESSNDTTEAILSATYPGLRHRETISPSQAVLVTILYYLSHLLFQVLITTGALPELSHCMITQPRKTFAKFVFPDSDTYTHLAIDEAIHQFSLAKTSYLSTAPKILLLITDGYASDNRLTFAAGKNARIAGLLAYAIPLGINTFHPDLAALARYNATNVLSFSSMYDLTEVSYIMNNEACNTPLNRSILNIRSDVLLRNEFRYFAYDLNADGITLKIDMEIGKIKAYFSYTFNSPSAAVFDAEINGTIYIRNPNLWDIDEFQIFIGVQGLEEVNNFTIILEEVEEETFSLLYEGNIDIIVPTTVQGYEPEPTTFVRGAPSLPLMPVISPSSIMYFQFWLVVLFVFGWNRFINPMW